MCGSEGLINILAILPTPEDRAALKAIARQSGWNLGIAEALRQARLLIDKQPAGVVLCDCRLPDGGWQDALRELQQRRLEPLLIVVSRLADEGLWAEVLNLGGYDVLATPLEPWEVNRSVRLAWQHWQNKLAREKRGGKVIAAGSRGWWP